jgi:hypothetical protein
VELLVTLMVCSGERNGERKRGSDCGDDAWRRGRRGGGGWPATKTRLRRARVAQQRRAQDKGGGGMLTGGVGWHCAGRRGSNGI